MREIVLADAGPLIALSRIDALDLLPGVFGRVMITAEIREEVLPAIDYRGRDLIAGALAAGWLSCLPESTSDWQPINPGLDAGECSAISAALQIPGCLLIIDDRAGRAEAKAHGLSVIGTAAVIGLARVQGLIPAARPLLEQLQPAGYFIHPNIVEAVLREIGE